ESKKIIEAVKASRSIVDGFIKHQNILFVWSTDESKALMEICKKLKILMKERGEVMTMDNLNSILFDLLTKLDKYHRDNFSMKMINKNFNKVINGAKNNKDAEWDAWVAQFN